MHEPFSLETITKILVNKRTFFSKAASRKHFKSVTITAKAAEGQCKAAQAAPQPGLITDHQPTSNHNVFYPCLGGSPLHSSLIFGFRHQSTDECYTAVFKPVFQCAQLVNSCIQNTLTWVLSVAQLILSVFSLSSEDLPCQEWPEFTSRHATRQCSKTYVVIKPA